jgi:RNA polymerase sigma-70 factor (ECF subfamily)
VDDEPDAAVIVASLTTPGRFGVVFDRHATVLHRYLVRRLGPDEGENLVGEVFRIAFEKRHTYDPARPSARPWLYGIASNLVAKHRRREARRLRATARLAGRRLAPDDLADRVSGALDADRLWHRVADAVAALPEPERDALLLHVWEGLPYDDIATAQGVPVGTVRSRLHRARGRLRELAAPGGEEDHESSDSPDPGRIGS